MDSSAVPQTRPAFSPFVPLLLLQVAMIVVMAWQLTISSRQRSALRQVEKSRADVVAQSRAVQGDLERLANGLLDLAETDPVARELVQRYGISRGTAAR